jgi:hypothetical protein
VGKEKIVEIVIIKTGNKNEMENIINLLEDAEQSGVLDFEFSVSHAYTDHKNNIQTT